MNSMSRLGTGIGIMIAIVACLSYIRLPLGELIDQQATLAAEDAREVVIDENFEAIEQRRSEEMHIVNDLHDGRVNLLEAARRFRTISSQLPDFWQDRLRARFGAGADELWSCRWVITFVQRDAEMDEKNRAELLGRLDCEFCDLVHDGTFDRSGTAEVKPSGTTR